MQDGESKPDDMIGFLRRSHDIADQDIEKLRTIPKFLAAVFAYEHGLIPLGYAAFVVWNDVLTILPNLTGAKLLDLVKYAGWRSRLGGSDPRYIQIDYHKSRAGFPSLFQREDHSKLREISAKFVAEMGDFLASHPQRTAYVSGPRLQEERNYAEYWLRASPNSVAPLLSNRRFRAGLDADRQGFLSYGGLLEKVFDDISYVLFPEIGYHMSGLALFQLASAADQGSLSIPENLRLEFPDLYELYNPEAFGRNK
jgi:hypothetical protein